MQQLVFAQLLPLHLAMPTSLLCIIERLLAPASKKFWWHLCVLRALIHTHIRNSIAMLRRTLRYDAAVAAAVCSRSLLIAVVVCATISARLVDGCARMVPPPVTTSL